MTRQAFLSYSREDGAQVSGVAQRLQQLGFDVWRDVALHGGQVWWDEILDRIRGCDVFVAVVSTASLKSQACARERSYAEALGKTVVPVAIERIHIPMPADILSRQVVDYTSDSADAAFGLASALIGVPADVPLPESLPTPPEIPLSYLTRLVGLIETSDELTRTQQLGILDDLEPGLRATDPEERDGAWHILGVLEARPDLFADTARRITQLRAEYTSRRPRNGSIDPVMASETGDPTGQGIAEADPLAQTPTAVESSQSHNPETESSTWEAEASEAGEAAEASEADLVDPTLGTAATTSPPPPASHHEPDHQPGEPKWLYVAVVGVLAVLVIWAIVVGLANPDGVEVPPVEGKRIELATAEIREVGLRPILIEEQIEGDGPFEICTGLDPGAGSVLSRGDEVRVFMSVPGPNNGGD